MYTFYIGLCLRLVESHGVLVHQWDLKMRDFIEFGRVRLALHGCQHWYKSKTDSANSSIS
jgi:hypothetical protein